MTKNCVFTYPSVIRRPRSLCSLLEFRGEVHHKESKVMGILCDENCKLHDPNYNRHRLIHPCDRRTDRRTGDSI